VLTLSSLPLLPLGTVLFPGGLLPLRIFEVRYLDMIGKCLKAGAPFGVVSLVRGSEVRQPGATEELAEVGTLAIINEAQQVQPSLLNILCTGTQRFRILRSEQLKHGLWVADVQRIADDAQTPVPADLKGVATALSKLLETLGERGTPNGRIPAEQMRLDECGWVANRWCEILPLPQSMKQQLMALDNPLIRLELVSDFLARAQIAP
jgi:Lon protease-like protein